MAAAMITREGELTLVHHLATTDQITRPPRGRRCALATDGGVWVMDLDEARVVTQIPLARSVAGMRMPDDDTLLVLTRDGVLGSYALPDGGCTNQRMDLGAWAIMGHTPQTVILAGAASLGLSRDGERIEASECDTIFHVIDLPSFKSTDINAGRFAEALNARSTEHAGIDPARADLSPWGALSPDGETFAFSYGARANPLRPWFPGMLDEGEWSHVYSFRVSDPELTMERWAAPLEGWTLGWRDRDTLSGYVSVTTGPPPYRTMPFARRRIHRDGAVVTWRPADTDLLLAPRASARARDLDDGSIAAWITSPGNANLKVWDPSTRATRAEDLLAVVPRSALHPEAPVLVDVWPDGGVARALPLKNGRTRITADGRARAETPARLGPPSSLEAQGERVSIRWTAQDAPWCTAWVTRGR